MSELTPEQQLQVRLRSVAGEVAEILNQRFAGEDPNYAFTVLLGLFATRCLRLKVAQRDAMKSLAEVWENERRNQADPERGLIVLPGER